MWFWIVSSIAGSILGSATSSWFEKTAMGRWFNRKMENIYNWAAKRYGFEVLKSEEKWKKKYPNIAKKIDELEKYVFLSRQNYHFLCNESNNNRTTDYQPSPLF